jgi:thiamine biosynthesis lipoprotein
MPAEIRFSAMGCEVQLLVEGPVSLLEHGRRRIAELERRWSRFDPASEISRLNGADGALCVVSPETFGLIDRAVHAWWSTGGRFDPTVLGDVVRAGYDRSFNRLERDQTVAPTSDLTTGCGGITLVRSASAIALPRSVGFDPGGIGKGFAADLVALELSEAGAAGALVNLGGDVRVTGRLLDGRPWTVAVEHPDPDRPAVAVAGLASGAVATSSRSRRTWKVGGRAAHHLIDPSTGSPAAGDVVSATVVAGECWHAEVLAKSALIAGTDGLKLVASAGADGLAVLSDDRVLTTEGFADFCLAGSTGSGNLR